MAPPPLWPILMEIEVGLTRHVPCLMLTMRSDGSFRQYVETFLSATYKPDLFHPRSAASVTDKVVAAPPQPNLPPWR